MIEWIIGFLAAKWWIEKEEKNKQKIKQCQTYSGNVEIKIPFGYVRDGEKIQDLQ